MIELPQRPGPKPTTNYGLPHEQLDQNPSAEAHGRLKDRAFDFPLVVRQPSQISVPGAEALWLSERPEHSCAAAFMIGNEFAHVHPPYDGSLHMMLPVEQARELIAKGWGEHHPLVPTGRLPETAVMVFGPRDDQEIALVLDLIGQSHAFASGKIGSDAKSE
jgi:hypothetical protein